MSSGLKLITVESPFIGMGRSLVTNFDQLSVAGRETFREDLLACRVQVTGVPMEGAV